MGVVCDRLNLPLQVVLTVTGVVSVVLIMLLFWKAFEASLTYEQQVCHVGALTYSLAIIAWPFLVQSITSPSLLRESSCAWIGVAWPPISLLITVLSIDESHFSSYTPRQVMQMDTNHLMSLAFAITSVIGTNVSKKFASSTAPLFSAVVIMCLCFVVPGTSSPKTFATTAAYVIQKVVVTYCIGLILIGMSVNFEVSKRRIGDQYHSYIDATKES